MQTMNKIGLDPAKADQLASLLNDLLGNYSIWYQNVRGFHWNIKGGNFFELHAKFEELYSDLQVKIDEIAERILTLGATPEHRYSGYLNSSSVKESSEVSDGKKAVSQILDSMEVILAKQRKILALSDEAGDEGTNSLVSEYIRQQEKIVWMYSAFLNR